MFEEQKSSGNVLEALQAASERLGTRLAVAGATEKAAELSGQSYDLAQIRWNRGQWLIRTFKGQQRLPLVLLKAGATRSQRLGAPQFLEMLNPPRNHQINA